jgi:hypothetical protein
MLASGSMPAAAVVPSMRLTKIEVYGNPSSG